ELEQEGPLEVKVSVWDGGTKRPCPYPELLLVSTLNPEAGSVRGTSLLRGLPFVSEVLLKIYKTLGVNWERLGNVRFAVTCKPDPSGMYAGERARQMAQEWQRAMRGGEVSDFVAVGDVSIKAIGADNQILDSEVPVRQMLEQIVAKLGVPPFLLGLSWSSTERMSSQQADMLTSELDAYRRVLTPVIRRICRTWLSLRGYNPQCHVEWDEITMQDEVDHANARYLNAQARQLEREEEQL
ncbi:MAG: serine/threonine protein phosphatase, partial [Acutalibacter sp.]